MNASCLPQRVNARGSKSVDPCARGNPLSTESGRQTLWHRLTRHEQPWHFRWVRTSGAVALNHGLESFLRETSVRAFRIARISLRNDADAGDAVQEAMIRMVASYADRPDHEWAPLFYAILRNCVHDEQRRRKSRGSMLSWIARLSGKEEAVIPGPAEDTAMDEGLARLERALADLPERQREAFLLRNVEELDVAQTAAAMGCSEGSVKTHYSRAVHALRARLGRT
jgi:RNA polymerase sigma-70 factor (ECF subfamily)